MKKNEMKKIHELVVNIKYVFDSCRQFLLVNIFMCK